MMKKYTLILIAICLASLQSFSQTSSFVGYRSGNFTGVNGVFFNPSSIADSRYRWDVNLLSANVGLGNNNIQLSIKDYKDIFDNIDSVLFGNTSKNTNGFVNIDILGPSFMFNVGKKWSFAITTRARTIANIKDIDGNFIKSLTDNVETLPYTFGSGANQQAKANIWQDIGVSAAREIYNNGPHYIKAGFTAKYVMGSNNTHVQVANLKGTVKDDILRNDIYITDATGTLSVGLAGIDITKDNFLKLENIKKESGKGFGGDIGFTYEYRPDAEEKANHQNKYKLKVGLSLLDIGSVKYKANANYYGSYTINTGSNAFYPSELNGLDADSIKIYFDDHPNLFTNNTKTKGSYNAKLPTSLQLNVDYAIGKGFYVDAAGQLNLSTPTDVYGAFAYNAVTITPRYEGRNFGIYVPLNFNNVTGFNPGISLRAGPLFFGSGSVIKLVADKSKQADFHFGLRFGMLKSKRKVKEPIVFVPPVIVPEKPADTDADGILDKDDKCPTVAGLEKYAGCPIPDTDGDGVNDEVDKCINVVGLARYNGCPIPDTDGDGVNDEEDKCPTRAGVASNQGCPEITKEVKDKINFAAKNVFFVTGSYKLLTKSYTGLNQVVKLMSDDASLMLDISGYTDSKGTDLLNQTLSENRANAVKDYLISKGIDESRLISKGFGEANPVADNATEAGRALNRRTEINVRNY